VIFAPSLLSREALAELRRKLSMLHVSSVEQLYPDSICLAQIL
jgi:hypothetical protein